MQLIFTHILWIWILLSMHHNFLGSEGLQGTHIDALNPFSSKLMTLTPRGGLWTFSAILAHCAPPLCVACFAKKAFCNTLLLIVCVHLLHQNCKSRSTSSSTRSRRLRGEGGSPMQNLLLFWLRITLHFSSAADCLHSLPLQQCERRRQRWRAHCTP